MRLTKSMMVFSLIALLSSGCLYANYKAPYDTVIDKTGPGQKTGRASVHLVMWSFSWGDSGVSAAAKDGGIDTVNHMDKEILQILFGFYTRITTVVYGN